ncbi:MAG: right-handed parallel beta-helix repeat-containing protein [Porphyromonadaceae bacterium]|nr:right-handed parallel beta-helix repeat-containing protein [Porphyromonadaceae bacterium]
MKEQVLKNRQPWKNAFDSLTIQTDLNFKINPYTHVMRGPYARPNIGGDDLSRGSEMAYNCAILWYISGEKKYADKAIEILDSWSPVLWDFDYNDAKLLAAWTGHKLCNAAEILRYTNSGWSREGQEQFKHTLMTVYYPLLRYYFPKANGNWDGAIIHSILAMAVYMDNREMFQNGIDHFLYGPVNGSVFKYIWPSGQCQETLRDQGHVQLGLGEFAGAARVAYTQGVDLFSIANNRIALGFEYTASFILGEMPHSYGKISERAKNIRNDDYEYVYRHYDGQGIGVPFTKMAADKARSKANLSVLTAFRASFLKNDHNKKVEPSNIAWPAGARETPLTKISEKAIWVNPGEPVQEAIDRAAKQGGWVVLKAGIHKIPNRLQMPSNTTLSGEGLQSVLYLAPEGGREAIVNKNNDMNNVTICDLVIECALNTDYGSDPNSSRSFRSLGNRGGIMFLGNSEGAINHITLQNITVRNATYNGVFISGSGNVNIIDCDFSENGSDVIPGPKLQHNLLLTHSKDINIKNSRFVTSPHGSGIALSSCKNATVKQCEIARNAYYGLLISESENVKIAGNLIEGNDRSGIMAEYLSHGSQKIDINNNLVHYNKGFGIESYATRDMVATGNRLIGNREMKQSKIVNDPYIVME